ncbi:PD-(D/E)XK nuclease family protein [Winogradskyella alexanderae]|uniref:PD-(D/E)XK nuclease family protein n=1 Tax=Winogradskyella alexanderae TaxID=2877123 RepID=A0ABS7XMF7_9FLAO|nr:PD-(D/E)XK nuclease family protein [Winogradskyella alexanderae]MCA0131195.1 PD-(D/E)XK nuclease family protein [Winogradskyella alexanderae]
MKSFIKSVLLHLKNKNLNFEELLFVLPSKRAGLFIKHELAPLIDKPIFSPSIKSIDEFIEELSGLKVLPNIDLTFRLYDTYKKITPKEELETFDSFSKWSQTLLQDFNEIDRYLVEHKQIFDYLTAIKELNHWSKETNQTELIKNHLQFWNRLKVFYSVFTKDLLEFKSGYQGLIYREACENLEAYIENNNGKIHVFLGFNALNKAESLIIQELLESDQAHIYWDIDESFITDPIHDAGLFIRQHKTSWNYFKNQAFNWLTKDYQKEKTIEIVGVPKLIGQAKYIGQLLEAIDTKQPDFTKVAVVLGEENLLLPLLNSLPKSIKKLNVTMGLELKYTPLASAFNLLFKIHQKSPSSFYYKDVTNILSHPSFYQLFDSPNGNLANKLLREIQTKNLTFLTSEKLNSISGSKSNTIELFFNSWNNNPALGIKNCIDIISRIKNKIDVKKTEKALELEYLYSFNKLFNQLQLLNEKYKYLDSIASLYAVYNDLLASETLDFEGEPLEGLQIMGMLESRVLDFETVIISSVNEGILPSGKTNNSFIPFDVKRENGLPTFKEKDAVYTYHFYRLLQRSKNIYILYNTDNDAINGGEKSRFITQLEIEDIHKIRHKIVSSQIPALIKDKTEILKTEMVLEAIQELSCKGFSPSSLTNYIRNPIDFYYQKILGVEEFDDVEENIAHNTLGSVIHKTLEDFYRPMEKKILTVEYLNSLKENINLSVSEHFKMFYKEGDFSKGKNLIIFNIAKHYIEAFINNEIETLKKGNVIKIIAIEAKTSCAIKIEGIDFPIRLKGTVDRIDQFNGTTRIVDYKTGKVEQSKVEIIDWEEITTDYDKFSKSFQVLCYSYMLYRQKSINLPVEAGIISFKNLKKGFLKFGTKATLRATTKKQLISEETLLNFEVELKKLIAEICNPNINFIEKDIDQ